MKLVKRKIESLLKINFELMSFGCRGTSPRKFDSAAKKTSSQIDSLFELDYDKVVKIIKDKCWPGTSATMCSELARAIVAGNIFKEKT